MQPANTNAGATAEASRANGHSTLHDIFVLSDEQILEIDPAPQDVEVAAVAPASLPVTSEDAARIAAPARASADAAVPAAQQSAREAGSPDANPTNAAPAGRPGPLEPPAWLAAQMKDTWNGAEARALWDRVQASENEAAAYRAVFAKPEEARAIKALYPGGPAQAQAAADRARLLDEIDRAYFAAQASTPEQARASRAQLAAMMLREDPAAFREMVYEGLRALEASEGRTGMRSVADALASPLGARLASPAAEGAPAASGGARPSPTAPVSAAAQNANAAPQTGRTAASEAQLAAYRTFEKTANAELEKSVGSAIDRALRQALPNIQAADASSSAGAPHSFGSTPDKIAPVQARLSQAIREDVERALQSDRQLGEQVAQILASRRLDDATRAQVVRLINDRALQLVPSAAKRALNEWTQATLSAHRSRTTRSEAAASRREVTAAAAAPRDAHGQASRPGAASSGPGNHASQADSRGAAKGRVNYGKLSDEQILDL